MDKTHIYKNKIKEAIKSKLVIQNNQSVDFAVDEVLKIVVNCYWDGYQLGYKESTIEATKEIQKNYYPKK